MAAEIIDGKAFAAKVRGQVAEHVTRLKEEHGITPGLAPRCGGCCTHIEFASRSPPRQLEARNTRRTYTNKQTL